MPFGDFMKDIPTPVFLVIHTTLAVVGLVLWRGARARGNAIAASAFLLYVLGEIIYVVYHLDVITFLFAHTLAEVCDALAIVQLSRAIATRTGP